MRLIDADELKDRLKEYCIDGDTNAEYWYSIMGIDDCINNAPTIDAVEIVRCKDCYYFTSGKYCGLNTGEATNEDDYCSYGARREE